MQYCLYYWLIAPLRDGLNDSPARQPVWTIPIDLATYEPMELALYLDAHGLPHFGRLKIRNLPSASMPQELEPLLLAVREHLLSVLRMTYRPDVRLAQPSSVHGFFRDEDSYDVRLQIDQYESVNFDPEPTKHLFVQSFDLREHLRLYMDGSDERIPVQYRFLSLYKLLELLYRPHGQWRKRELQSRLAPFQTMLSEQGFTSDPSVLLHELRDKCAHIRVGKSAEREERGASYLNAKQLARVQRALPALRSACLASLNEIAAGKFQIGPRQQCSGPTTSDA
mgnify:CR=1 FL=1